MADEPPDDPVLLIVGPRRRGRPPADEPHDRLTVYLPRETIDALWRTAAQRGEPVSRVLRDAVLRWLPPR